MIPFMEYARWETFESIYCQIDPNATLECYAFIFIATFLVSRCVTPRCDTSGRMSRESIPPLSYFTPNWETLSLSCPLRNLIVPREDLSSSFLLSLEFSQ